MCGQSDTRLGVTETFEEPLLLEVVARIHDPLSSNARRMHVMTVERMPLCPRRQLQVHSATTAPPVDADAADTRVATVTDGAEDAAKVAEAEAEAAAQAQAQARVKFEAEAKAEAEAEAAAAAAKAVPAAGVNHALRLRQPSAENVLALANLVGVGQDDNRLQALGGYPRALERFLNHNNAARDGGLKKAAKMLSTTLAFREKYQLDVPADEPRSAQLAKVGEHWVGEHCGTSADGHPIVYFAFGDLDPKRLMSIITEQDFAAFYLSFMDSGLTRQRECSGSSCSADWKGMIEIYDMKGISFSQLYFPGLLMLNRVLAFGAQHYPDNLHKAVIINVPYIFGTAWSVIKRVLHEEAVARIELRSDSADTQLSALLGGADSFAQVRQKYAEIRAQRADSNLLASARAA